jgi:hypothetical protein
MPLNTNKKPGELAVLIGLGGKRPERGAPPSMSAYSPKPAPGKMSGGMGGGMIGGPGPMEGAEREQVSSEPCIHAAMCPFYNKQVEAEEPEPMGPPEAPPEENA